MDRHGNIWVTDVGAHQVNKEMNLHCFKTGLVLLSCILRPSDEINRVEKLCFNLVKSRLNERKYLFIELLNKSICFLSAFLENNLCGKATKLYTYMMSKVALRESQLSIDYTFLH